MAISRSNMPKQMQGKMKRKNYRVGGKVRGCGCAKRSVKKAKMY